MDPVTCAYLGHLKMAAVAWIATHRYGHFMNGLRVCQMERDPSTNRFPLKICGYGRDRCPVSFKCQFDRCSCSAFEDGRVVHQLWCSVRIRGVSTRIRRGSDVRAHSLRTQTRLARVRGWLGWKAIDEGHVGLKEELREQDKFRRAS